MCIYNNMVMPKNLDGPTAIVRIFIPCKASPYGDKMLAKLTCVVVWTTKSIFL